MEYSKGIITDFHLENNKIIIIICLEKNVGLCYNFYGGFIPLCFFNITKLLCLYSSAFSVLF